MALTLGYFYANLYLLGYYLSHCLGQTLVTQEINELVFAISLTLHRFNEAKIFQSIQKFSCGRWC